MADKSDRQIFDTVLRAYLEAKAADAMESDLDGFNAVCWYYADWIMDRLAESCDPPTIVATTHHMVPFPPGMIEVKGYRIAKPDRQGGGRHDDQ